jgi:hypothetical protein
MVSVAVVFFMSVVFTACATTQGEVASAPGPGGAPPSGELAGGPGGGPGGGPQAEEEPYTLIPITMQMEAGAAQYEAWPGGGKTIHAGIGWILPFGRSEYVAGMEYPETEEYPMPSYFNDEFMSAYSARLFCIYHLADGDIYAYDGITGNYKPELTDGDDGKIDYLINVIVGGTGAYEGATGMLLGMTPGRGASTNVGDDVSLPVSILKIMEGYIKIPEK